MPILLGKRNASNFLDFDHHVNLSGSCWNSKISRDYWTLLGTDKGLVPSTYLM